MFIKLLLVTLCLVSIIAAEIQKKNNVLILTKDNFDEAISGKNVLVKFYAPWCGWSKKLAPEFEKAAKILADENSPLVLAEVDATVERELARKYEIRGYPTVIFFSKGKTTKYLGRRIAEDMVGWLKWKTGQ